MKKQAGYFYLFLTFFCWGSIYVVSKYALAQMGAVTVACFRYLVSVAALALILKYKGTKKPIKNGHWKYLFLVGIVGYFISIVFQLAGTSLLTGSLSSLINSMNPVAISILAAVFLGEKITGKNVISIIISFIGVYVILGGGNTGIDPMGIVCCIVSVILWSLSSVTVRKISADYDPVQTSLYAMLIALLFNIPAAVGENLFITPCHFTGVAVAACIYLGLIGTAVGHTCWNKSLQILDASTCSMFYPLQPLISAILGVVLLHEQLSGKFIAGGLLICAGILVTVAPSPAHKTESGR